MLNSQEVVTGKVAHSPLRLVTTLSEVVGYAFLSKAVRETNLMVSAKGATAGAAQKQKSWALNCGLKTITEKHLGRGSFDIAMENLHQTLGSLGFTRADFRILAEYMKFNFAFDDLHQ
jgi:hypothetical protein